MDLKKITLPAWTAKQPPALLCSSHCNQRARLEAAPEQKGEGQRLRPPKPNHHVVQGTRLILFLEQQRARRGRRVLERRATRTKGKQRQQQQQQHFTLLRAPPPQSKRETETNFSPLTHYQHQHFSHTHTPPFSSALMRESAAGCLLSRGGRPRKTNKNKTQKKGLLC